MHGSSIRGGCNFSEASRRKRAGRGIPLGQWRRASEVLRNIRRSQNVCVGIAVSAADGRRGRYAREPLEERFILRMPSGAVQGDGRLRVREAFNNVAGFQVVLTISIGREPPGRGVVHKGIVEGLGQLVAEHNDVAEGRIAEDARRNPTRVVHHITPLAEAVGSVACLKVVSVEAEDAAVFWVADVEKSIGKEKSGDVARADVTGGLSGTDGCGGVRPRKRGREKGVHECVGVDQNKGAARAVGVEGKAIRAADEHHGSRRLNARAQQGVPLAGSFVEELCPLNRVGELSGSRA